MNKLKLTAALAISVLAVAYHIYSLQFIDTVKIIIERAFG